HEAGLAHVRAPGEGDFGADGLREKLHLRRGEQEGDRPREQPPPGLDHLGVVLRAQRLVCGGLGHWFSCPGLKAYALCLRFSALAAAFAACSAARSLSWRFISIHCWRMESTLLTVQYSTRPAANGARMKVKMI